MEKFADDGQRKYPALPGKVVLNPGDGEPPVDSEGQEEPSTFPKEIRAALTIEAACYRVITRKKEDLKSIDATRVHL